MKTIFYIISFSVWAGLYLYLYFVGDTYRQSIKVIKKVFVPAGFIIYALDVYFYRTPLAIKSTAIYMLFSFFVILCLKGAVWVESKSSNPETEHSNSKLYIDRFVSGLCILLPMALCMALVEIIELIMGWR